MCTIKPSDIKGLFTFFFWTWAKNQTNINIPYDCWMPCTHLHNHDQGECYETQQLRHNQSMFDTTVLHPVVNELINNVYKERETQYIGQYIYMIHEQLWTLTPLTSINVHEYVDEHEYVDAVFV